MDRRTALQLAGATLLAACGRKTEHVVTPAAPTRLPVIFLAHGSPMLLDDAGWVNELAAWAAAMPRPKSILMLSAHWVDRPIVLGAKRTVPLVYDFFGFPGRHYEVTYAAPGAPSLAERVRGLLSSQPVADADDRGLDHGAYVPLVAMYPRADVPVLQMSIPTLDPAALMKLGRALAPLRDEGVLIVGSGFLTHNMGAFDFSPGARPPSWASEFDEWSRVTLEKRDADALAAYRSRAPGVTQSLPTHEHFVPVAVAMGASLDRGDAVRFPITGFMAGSFSRRSVQFG